ELAWIAAGLALLAACDAGDRRGQPPGYEGVIELDERRLAFEVPGRVVEMAARPGAEVQAGELLARLDDALVRTEREGREADARAARARADQVARTGGGRAIEAANAQVDAANAAVRLESERVERHQLRAIERGRVLELHVERGEVVGAGAPVVSVADPTRPHVDVFVPQQELAGIGVGARAEVRVDATRGAFAGVVEDVARRTAFTPRFLFSERERANLVVRVRVRIEDPREQLHAGVPAFVVISRAPRGTTAGARR
ncbi:MAG: HlyD family secretion protein, partial [Kofleriaceae bacterium]